jgi:hypothetical protein
MNLESNFPFGAALRLIIQIMALKINVPLIAVLRNFRVKRREVEAG